MNLKPILKSFGRTLELLEKHNLSNGNVRAKYAELYALDKLQKHKPRYGGDREVKSADIELANGKRAEVKSSAPYDDKGYECWAWAFQINQLKEHKFDYVILFGFNKEGKIKVTFILTYRDFKNHPFNRKYSWVPGANTYIEYSPDYFEEYEGEKKESKIEVKLNKHPELFRNKWGKIK